MNDKVKELRKLLNLTQKEFGERIGLKPNSISDIENGKNSLTDIVLKSICKEFNVNEEWLRTGKGEMFVDVLPEDELGAYLGKIGTGDYPEIERIIKAYFRLPEESQRAVDLFLKSLAGDTEN
ncbi:helix-turn-helix domain-containing protein [Eubacterium callanderi]|uniref:helix-turn-helix domain-containing protein n=1 Tax=Eubacterium callanderi TaxID=53442 RepID=UPI0008E5A434|nr:helix-turn-helix transcriptional regulator [Eubacterium callanderi]SFO62862.1 DNA-binding transcriptional regulator, XRE-family HTH domain [Eubacterium callanderi]